MDALNKCVEVAAKQNGLLSGSRFYREMRQKRDARFIGQYPEDAPFWGTNLVR